MSYRKDFKKLYEYLYSNFKTIQSLENTIIKVEKHNIEEGDEWNSTSGTEFRIWLFDKSSFVIGEYYRVEDDENWGQADSWEETQCRYYDDEGRNVEPSLVYNKILEAIQKTEEK